MKVQLWDRRSEQVVLAEVLSEMTPQQLVAAELRWRQFRATARERLQREGSPVPEHDHWNWEEKSYELRFAAYRCLGIQYEEDVQGLMMISTLAAQSRSKAHKGKPVLYIKYIESAPWNLKLYVGKEARFGGVGVSLIRTAIAVSAEEEFRGRIALHSLPQAESFYTRFMEDLGIDEDIEGLRYFEMTEQQSLNFMKGGEV